jgi:hypothetical protein
LAAVWVVILGVNFSTRSGSAASAQAAAPVSPQMIMAFQEQQRLLNELLAPRETPVADRPRNAMPRPRSEREKSTMLLA